MTAHIAQRLTRLLAGRACKFIAVFAGLALTCPSLWTGFQFDDYLHAWSTRNGGGVPGPKIATDGFYNINGFYNFTDGSEEVNRASMEQGLFPWFTSANLRIHFCRPVTAVTHWLDYQLWPDHPWVMHLHNLLWYGAVIVAAGWAYRLVFGTTPAAGLAMLMYALNGNHANTVSWIANRNALMAACFGLLAFAAHVRRRKGGSSLWIALGGLLLVLGLFSSDTAVLVVGYLFAYALTIDEGRLRERLLSLLPMAAVSFGWLILRQMLDFGTSGSGGYIDPGSDPRGFLLAVFARTPVLMASGLHCYSADLYTFSSDANRPTVVLGCWLLVLVAGLVGRRLLARDAMFRFWCLSLVIGAVPLSAGFLSDRITIVLCFSGVGVAARFVELAWERREAIVQSFRWQPAIALLAWGILLNRLVLAPVMMVQRIESMDTLTGICRDAAMDPDFDSADLPHKHLVLLNPPDPLFNWYFSSIRGYESRSLPQTSRMLATGLTPFEMTRPDARTLVLRLSTDLLDSPGAKLFRDPQKSLAAGTKVNLSDVKITVLRDDPARKTREIAFEFDRSLDDPSMEFRIWQKDRYTRFPIIAVGETRAIPAAIDRTFFYGRGTALSHVVAGLNGRTTVR